MDCQLDIFFVEALLNGLLLAGLLALLALGLNLIFGVIDVVWICYVELVMVGMYGIHYAHKGGAPFLLAARRPCGRSGCRTCRPSPARRSKCRPCR